MTLPATAEVGSSNAVAQTDPTPTTDESTPAASMRNVGTTQLCASALVLPLLVAAGWGATRRRLRKR